MKNFIIIITIVLSKTAVCQVPEVLVKDPFYWKDWEVSFPQEEKLKILSSISDELFDILKNSHQNSLNDNLQNFHFIDTNNDGSLEIIYEGFAGAESEKIILFTNSYGKYIKVLDIFGKIFEISRSSVLSPVSFKIMDYPCCDELVYSLQEYVSFQNQDGQYEFSLSSKINFIDGTLFPNEFKEKPYFIRTINDKYLLRSTPKIENGGKMGYIVGEGNVLAEYPKESIGYVLSDAIDDTGRIWLFVVMVNNIKPNNSIILEGNNSGNHYGSFGWISSKYTEILDLK